jgi:uncharacterized protein (TIGR02246 family)
MPEPKHSKSHPKPEDWPRQFAERLNAGDVDAVMELYDPEARFVAPSGEILEGRDRIRDKVAALVGAKTIFQSSVVQAITAGDIAQLYTDFDGTALDPSGKTVEVQSRAIEVLRRQPDGSWLLIIGDPTGRK